MPGQLTLWIRLQQDASDKSLHGQQLMNIVNAARALPPVQQELVASEYYNAQRMYQHIPYRYRSSIGNEIFFAKQHAHAVANYFAQGNQTLPGYDDYTTWKALYRAAGSTEPEKMARKYCAGAGQFLTSEFKADIKELDRLNAQYLAAQKAGYQQRDKVYSEYAAANPAAAGSAQTKSVQEFQKARNIEVERSIQSRRITAAQARLMPVGQQFPALDSLDVGGLPEVSDYKSFASIAASRAQPSRLHPIARREFNRAMQGILKSGIEAGLDKAAWKQLFMHEMTQDAKPSDGPTIAKRAEQYANAMCNELDQWSTAETKRHERISKSAQPSKLWAKDREYFNKAASKIGQSGKSLPPYTDLKAWTERFTAALPEDKKGKAATYAKSYCAEAEKLVLKELKSLAKELKKREVEILKAQKQVYQTERKAYIAGAKACHPSDAKKYNKKYHAEATAHFKEADKLRNQLLEKMDEHRMLDAEFQHMKDKLFSPKLVKAQENLMKNGMSAKEAYKLAKDTTNVIARSAAKKQSSNTITGSPRASRSR